MTAIPGRRAPSGSKSGSLRTYTAQRHDTVIPWTGITTGFDARCWGCTWAINDGIYQIKYLNGFCPVPSHSRVHRQTGSRGELGVRPRGMKDSCAVVVLPLPAA